MVEAYVMIQTGAGTSQTALSAIRGIKGVKRANIVAGEFDIIAHIEAKSPQDLLRLVTEDIHTLDGVGRTRTSLILE